MQLTCEQSEAVRSMSYTFKNNDVGFLHTNFDSNLEFYLKLSGIFIKTIPDQLYQLSLAVRAADYDTIRSITHSVKGNYHWVGAGDMKVVLERIEVLATDKDIQVQKIYKEYRNRLNSTVESVKEENLSVKQHLSKSS